MSLGKSELVEGDRIEIRAPVWNWGYFSWEWVRGQVVEATHNRVIVRTQQFTGARKRKTFEMANQVDARVWRAERKHDA